MLNESRFIYKDSSETDEHKFCFRISYLNVISLLYIEVLDEKDILDADNIKCHIFAYHI